MNEGETTSLWRIAAMAGAISVLTAACAEPAAVKPIPDSARQSVTAISADVSGVKNTDTSTIGARGRSEGLQRGAQQGAAAMSSGGLLGLVLAPIGAAVGSSVGASDAQSEAVVDETRANLRIAMQETDFGEMLRSRLLATGAAGQIEIIGATSGSGTAPLTGANNQPVSQILALEYKVGFHHPRHVNPEIGIVATVTAQVISPDRKTRIHSATWTYCSPKQDFVRMGANQGAAVRSEIDAAASILAEAIPYDLYVTNQTRKRMYCTELSCRSCMDFSNLPSGRGRPPPALQP